MNCPRSEFSQEFVDGMSNRMAVSYYKYGAIKDAFPHKVNAIKSLLQRLKSYEETGNTEYLIDAANFAMIEFLQPSHVRAHFTPTDASGSPGRKWHAGGPATQRANS